MPTIKIELSIEDALRSLTNTEYRRWDLTEREQLQELYNRVFGTKHSLPVMPESLEDAMKLEIIRTNLQRVPLAVVEQTFGA